MKTAKNSKEALELIKKAKEGDVIVWDECKNLLLKGNPFKNYKQALKFLMSNIHNKTLLSNYKPTDVQVHISILKQIKKEQEK